MMFLCDEHLRDTWVCGLVQLLCSINSLHDECFTKSHSAESMILRDRIREGPYIIPKTPQWSFQYSNPVTPNKRSNRRKCGPQTQKSYKLLHSHSRYEYVSKYAGYVAASLYTLRIWSFRINLTSESLPQHTNARKHWCWPLPKTCWNLSTFKCQSTRWKTQRMPTFHKILSKILENLQKLLKFSHSQWICSKVTFHR